MQSSLIFYTCLVILFKAFGIVTFCEAVQADLLGKKTLSYVFLCMAIACMCVALGLLIGIFKALI